MQETIFKNGRQYPSHPVYNKNTQLTLNKLAFRLIKDLLKKTGILEYHSLSYLHRRRQIFVSEIKVSCKKYMLQEYFKCRHISHKSECPQVVVDKIVQLKVR
jgi:hypothetical protein